MSFKTPQPGDPAVLRHAFALLDLREIAGPEHDPDIVKLFVEAGHPEVRDDDTSWCAAFANAMIGRAGGKGTGMLTARSFLSWGEAVTTPRRGDIVVIKRGNSNWQGHVFFWLASDGDYVWGIGGNQGKFGAVTVSRFPKSKVLGIRRATGTTGAQAYPEALVRAVQQALRDRGYPQVGRIDGSYGPDTRGAILSFEAEHGLPLAGVPTGDILATILAAPVKAPAPERSSATPAEVRDQVPEVRASWLTKIVAMVSAVFSAIWAMITGVLGQVDGARELVRPAMELLTDLPPWFWFALIGLAAAAMWAFARQGELKGVMAFRKGERR